MNFGAPHWLWLLLGVPLLALLFAQAERRASSRLAQFVSARLLPDLAGTVDRFRRGFRFALLLCTLAFGLIALARPQWGYTFEDVKRKGLDLIFAVDTSRSMLSNDVQPNRLQRVKLAAQDLVNELQGDRVGLIAFAGRAFVQAPLTIDYDAAIDSINDLDTNTIPEGGTNISEAINLAVQTFGKSAIGNRALIIFTDGEELSGDSAKTAKAAADAGVRVFTIGVGTPEGSLIPITGEGGGTAFVKDSKGQVVKSKLDEKRLREAAEATGGFYMHLEDGPRTMKKLFVDGLGKMQAGEIDARLSRRPIERYQWLLGMAVFSLFASLLVSERKRSPRAARVRRNERAVATATAITALLMTATAFGASPGLDAYRGEKFGEAYEQFQRVLKEHPEARATDKILFDAGAAAYKMQDYGKALDSFSQALLSPDRSLQSQSHYNLGNTLYERGEKQTADDKKLSDWGNALQHYDQTLKFDPKNKEAKENYEFVKNKIEELKNKQDQATPTPPPSPSPTPQDKKNQKQDQKKDQPQNSPSKSDEQKQDKEKQDQKESDQSKSGDKEKPENGGDEKKPQDSEGKKEEKSDQKNPGDNPSPAPSSSPSPGESNPENNNESPSPSPSAGEQDERKNDGKSPENEPTETPTPAGDGSEAPSPSPTAGASGNAGKQGSPGATPSPSPGKKPAGEVKGAAEDKPDKDTQVAQAESDKEGQMSEKQAELLLRSMKDEEQRVQLDERKAPRHVYNDW